MANQDETTNQKWNEAQGLETSFQRVKAYDGRRKEAEDIEAIN